MEAKSKAMAVVQTSREIDDIEKLNMGSFRIRMMFGKIPVCSDYVTEQMKEVAREYNLPLHPPSTNKYVGRGKRMPFFTYWPKGKVPLVELPAQTKAKLDFVQNAKLKTDINIPGIGIVKATTRTLDEQYRLTTTDYHTIILWKLEASQPNEPKTWVQKDTLFSHCKITGFRLSFQQETLRAFVEHQYGNLTTVYIIDKNDTLTIPVTFYPIGIHPWDLEEVNPKRFSAGALSDYLQHYAIIEHISYGNNDDHYWVSLFANYGDKFCEMARFELPEAPRRIQFAGINLMIFPQQGTNHLMVDVAKLCRSNLYGPLDQQRLLLSRYTKPKNFSPGDFHDLKINTYLIKELLRQETPKSLNTAHWVGELQQRYEEFAASQQNGAGSQQAARPPKPTGGEMNSAGSSTGSSPDGSSSEGNSPPAPKKQLSKREQKKHEKQKKKQAKEQAKLEKRAQRNGRKSQPAPKAQANAVAKVNHPFPVFPESQVDWKSAQEIGEGAYGTVFAARAKRCKVELAIKTFKPSDSHYVENEKAFLTELAVLTLVVSPYVVEFMGLAIKDNTYFIATQRHQRTLHHVIFNEKRPYTALDIMLCSWKIFQGMMALHGQRVLWIDIKPENVLITKDGQVKICDFGVSVSLPAGEDCYVSSTILGTMHYLAPTVLFGQRDDVYVYGDVPDGVLKKSTEGYSWSLINYCLITGKEPYDRITHYLNHQYYRENGLEKEQDLPVPREFDPHKIKQPRALHFRFQAKPCKPDSPNKYLQNPAQPTQRDKAFESFKELTNSNMFSTRGGYSDNFNDTHMRQVLKDLGVDGDSPCPTFIK